MTSGPNMPRIQSHFGAVNALRKAGFDVRAVNGRRYEINSCIVSTNNLIGFARLVACGVPVLLGKRKRAKPEPEPKPRRAALIALAKQHQEQAAPPL